MEASELSKGEGKVYSEKVSTEGREVSLSKGTSVSGVAGGRKASLNSVIKWELGVQPWSGGVMVKGTTDQGQQVGPTTRRGQERRGSIWSAHEHDDEL